MTKAKSTVTESQFAEIKAKIDAMPQHNEHELVSVSARLGCAMDWVCSLPKQHADTIFQMADEYIGLIGHRFGKGWQHERDLQEFVDGKKEVKS